MPPNHHPEDVHRNGSPWWDTRYGMDGETQVSVPCVGKARNGDRTIKSQPSSHPPSPNCCWATHTRTEIRRQIHTLLSTAQCSADIFPNWGETSSESHCGLFRMIVERQNPASWAKLTRYVSFGAVSISPWRKRVVGGCMAHYEPRKGFFGSQPGRKPSL